MRKVLFFTCLSIVIVFFLLYNISLSQVRRCYYGIKWKIQPVKPALYM
jgi:hypothetical protein